MHNLLPYISIYHNYYQLCLFYISTLTTHNIYTVYGTVLEVLPPALAAYALLIAHAVDFNVKAITLLMKQSSHQAEALKGLIHSDCLAV